MKSEPHLIKEKKMQESRKSFNPSSLAPPKGPHCLVTKVSTNEFIYLSGMVPVDGKGELSGAGDFEAQIKQVFMNISLALEAAGVTFKNVLKFSTFLTDAALIKPFREFRTREFPMLFPDGQYPSNTLLVVSQLVSKEFLIEVEVVAAKYPALF